MAKKETEKEPKKNPEKKEGNKYDKIFKENLKELAPALLKIVLKMSNYRLEPLQQVRLQTTIEKEPDFLQIIFDNYSPEGRILQIEFEGKDEIITNYRMGEYAGIENKIHQMEIEQHLIYFGIGKPKNITGKIKNRFYIYRYKVHCITDVSFKAFLYADTPQEVIFAILASPEGLSSDEIIRMILERILQLSGEKVAFKKFIRQLVMLSRKRNLHEITINKAKAMIEYKEYEDDVFYHIGVDKGIEQGQEKGKEEKAIIAIRNMVKKGFIAESISEILEVKTPYVKKIQKQLLKETAIIKLLKTVDKNVEEIAIELKVNPLLVKVIKDHLDK